MNILWPIVASFFLGTTLVSGLGLAYSPSQAVPANDYGQETFESGETELNVRTGCITSRPGSAPFNVEHRTDAKWERRARAALAQMAVPADIQTEFVRRVRANQITDLVQLSNGGGVAMSSREQYLPHYTGTYTLTGRDVVCHGTRLALRPNETTGGALYIIGAYRIAVLQICGNLALLEPGSVRGPIVTNVHTVPEPSSLWLAAAGLAMLAAWHRFKGAFK